MTIWSTFSLKFFESFLLCLSFKVHKTINIKSNVIKLCVNKFLSFIMSRLCNYFRWSCPGSKCTTQGFVLGLLMVRSRPNGPRSGLWTESVWSQVSKTMWTIWTVEFFYHKSICFLLKILFYYHNSIQIINKNAKFIHCLYEFLFFLKSNFLNK